MRAGVLSCSLDSRISLGISFSSCIGAGADFGSVLGLVLLELST
jgi:hypothetical protein